MVAPNIATDANGNLYVTSFYGGRVYKVDQYGIVTTVAGNGSQGFSGDGGPATSASISFPEGVAVDTNGNIYIADTYNNRIRKVSTNGVITTVAGNGAQGYSGDGVAATSTSLNHPLSVAVDGSGTVYISDFLNNRIRKVSGGVITTFAGNGTAGYSGEGTATLVELNTPRRIALNRLGTALYIADAGNYRVRAVVAGVISTIAGNGNACYVTSGCAEAPDGIAATSSSLNVPAGVAVDNSNNVYIALENENRVRMVSGEVITPPWRGTGSARILGRRRVPDQREVEWSL